MSALDRWWFAGLLGHAFLLQIIMMLLRIAMTYEAVSIGLDVVSIGLIGGAFGALPAILALHTGRYIDQFGERIALAVGSAMALAASVGLWLVPATLGNLLIFSTVAGLAQFIGVAGQHSAVGKVGRERQAGYFGHLTMVISLAHTIGPVIFSLIVSHHSIPDTSIIFAVASLNSLLLLAATALVKTPANAVRSEAGSLWSTAGSILRTKGYVRATITSLVVFSAMDLLVIYLPLFGTEHDLSAATVGLLLSLRGAASVVSRLFFGPLYRNVARGRLLTLALVGSGAAIALVPLMSSVPVIGLLIFGAGLGLGVGAPLTLAWIGEIIPPLKMGSAVSLRLAINRAGQAVLPVAVGAVASGIGASAIIVTIGGSLLLSGGLSTFIDRSK